MSVAVNLLIHSCDNYLTPFLCRPLKAPDTPVTIMARQVESLAWKVGQQQAELFHLQMQLKRFKQFFKAEDAEAIAKGKMVPNKASFKQESAAEVGDVADAEEEAPIEEIFFTQQFPYEGESNEFYPEEQEEDEATDTDDAEESQKMETNEDEDEDCEIFDE